MDIVQRGGEEGNEDARLDDWGGAAETQGQTAGPSGLQGDLQQVGTGILLSHMCSWYRTSRIRAFMKCDEIFIYII